MLENKKEGRPKKRWGDEGAQGVKHKVARNGGEGGGRKRRAKMAKKGYEGDERKW